MRAARRALLLTSLIASAGAIGCGGGASTPTTTTTATTARDAPPATAVSIDAPRAKTTVRGRAYGRTRMSVNVRISGTAGQQQLVRVDGHCAARSCLRMALADLTGTWSARLRLVLPARTRHASISASYALGDRSRRPAHLLLRIRPPHRAAPSTSSRGSAGTSDDEAIDGSAPQDGAAQSGTAAPAAPPASSPGHGTAVVIGDSLAVGIEGLLQGALPGWTVRIDGRTGRPLAEGMQVLAGTDLPRDAVLAISLFTNDDPTHTAALRAAVQQTLARVGPDGCVVWATIKRPPLNGVSYQAANALLLQTAQRDPRLQIVPWAEQMASHPELLRPDGVHPTPSGYQLRARLYAAAIASC